MYFLTKNIFHVNLTSNRSFFALCFDFLGEGRKTFHPGCYKTLKRSTEEFEKCDRQVRRGIRKKMLRCTHCLPRVSNDKLLVTYNVST